jgi:general secretion pathway protein K
MHNRKSRQYKSGMILIVVLWILLILTLFALGMSRQINLDLILNRYSIDKLKSYYAAKAAVQYAIARLGKDSQGNQSNNFDSLYECGIALAEGETPESIFKEVKLGDSSFAVSYLFSGDENNQTQVIYGLEDEERKINLNGINAGNFKVLIRLMELMGIDSEIAQTVASSVVDWHDSNSVVTNLGFGAEDDYYTGLEPDYHSKNSYFQSLEELLLVKGVTKEIYQKLKNYLTIFPLDANSLRINVNTAERKVLQALANSALEHVPGTSQPDADDLVQKIIDYRKGDDNIIATADDQLVEANKLGLNSSELALFAYLNNNFFIAKSNYFRINVLGAYKDKKVKSKVVVVVERGNTLPLFWHED